MGLEVEAKLRVESHDAVRQALVGAGAAPLGAVMETNHILDADDGSLRAAGAGLRVRVSAPLQDDDATVTLTYKGRRERSALKRRPEIEVVVAEADTTLQLLARLGYVERVVFAKRRESHRLSSCRVELDELPLLGCFVEIEGPEEESIQRVQALLGLSDLPHLSRSYVSMLVEVCQQLGRDPRRICFSDD